MEIIPHFIVFTIVIVQLTKEADNHGKERKAKKVNFWISLVVMLIAQFIYYWGGFWDQVIERF